MDSTDNVAIAPEEVPQYMEVIYATKDFELASVVHAIAPDIKFAGVRPILGGENRHRQMQKGKGVMYLILFTGETKSGEHFDPQAKIENIRKQYVNHELRVDPVALINSQRILRAAMHDSGPALRKNNDEH